MTYRKKVDVQFPYINSLRLVIGLLSILGLYIAYGWQSAPRDLTIHVPPDLRSDSTCQWWDVPTESVYAFGLYIFQQMSRWPVDGEVDYQDNIIRLGGYLTPSCKAYLQKYFELRRNSGKLRKRERGVFEIPGRGIDYTSEQHIEQNSINEWTVNLDITADEHYGGERVKRALARYPLHIIRSDADPEKNPFGLAWHCYSGNPRGHRPRVFKPFVSKHFSHRRQLRLVHDTLKDERGNAGVPIGIPNVGLHRLRSKRDENTQLYIPLGIRHRPMLVRL